MVAWAKGENSKGLRGAWSKGTLVQGSIHFGVYQYVLIALLCHNNNHSYLYFITYISTTHGGLEDQRSLGLRVQRSKGLRVWGSESLGLRVVWSKGQKFKDKQSKGKKSKGLMV